MCRKFFLLTSFVVVLGLASSASAQLIAYEPFDYPANGLSGNDGGSGWNGAWDGGQQVTAPGLDFSPLSVKGNKATVVGGDSFRDLPEPMGDNETQLWISFIGQADQQPGADMWGGVSFHEPDESLFLGVPWQAGDGDKVWGLDTKGDENRFTEIPITEKIFFVARIDFNTDGDNDTVTAWVRSINDPDPFDLTDETAFAQYTTRNIEFSRVRIAGAQPVNFDEIRLGMTLEDVLPKALPQGWQSQDIDTTGGSAAESDGTWAISADGADIWGSADEFRYAYVPLSGDGEIVAQVVSNGEGSNGWAKGGVMIRETLDADSKHALMALTGGEGGGMGFQNRQETGGNSFSSHGDPTAAPPYWVKLTRVGNTITGYSSADGVEWVQQPDGTGGDMTTNPVDIEMAANVYIGLFATSHAVGEIRTYTFDNVSIELPKAPNIVWVAGNHDDNADGEPDDQGWVDLLEAQGHTVDFQIGIWEELDDWKIAALNAADLVIISRCSNSGSYDDDDEVAQWNSVTTPMINSSTHLIRSSRWRWLDTTSLPNLSDAIVDIVVPDNPIFAGVESPAWISDGLVGPTTYADITGVGVGNGTLLAKVADTDVAWIVEWEAGVEFYPGSGEIATGPRMFFAAGSQEGTQATGEPIGRGELNLTPEGVTIFLNAVNSLLPAPPDVTAPGDIIKGVPDEPRDGSVAGWPDGEFPGLAVDDDVSTKFLHFRGEVSPTGFVIKPASGASIVTGLTFTTANDAPERDPIAFELSGSNESIDGPYELIASGDIVDFAQADAWPRFTMNATPISFDNDVAYAHYQVLFPAVRDPASANSMQIAEVELLGVPAPAGPIVHYKLDDGEGVIAVDSSNGLDGILMGDPQWSAGVLDGALDLDGDGDYVDCGTNDVLNNLSDAITVSAWVSIRSVTTTWMGIVMKGETAWRLGVNGDTTGIHWGFTGGDRGWQAANSVTELPLDEWHHIAGTYDRSVGGTVYVDGVAETVNPDPDGVRTNEMPLLLGENPEALGRFYDGLLDDVRIYDRALSAAELSELAGQ